MNWSPPAEFGLSVRQPARTVCSPPQVRRSRRRTNSQRLDAHARAITALAGRIDLADQDDLRQDAALTALEARLLDLEQVVERQVARIRELECQATTALAIGLVAGAGAGASSGARDVGGGSFDPCASASASGGAGASGAAGKSGSEQLT